MKWIEQCKKFSYQKCVVAKDWADCNSRHVIEFCQNVRFKSFLKRFSKSPKFKGAVKELCTTIKSDVEVPAAEDKVPLLDPLMNSISDLADDIAYLTDEVQTVKTTLKKTKSAKKNSVV